MATPHLTSSYASTAANRHLNGNGSHLLVVRKSTAWTNKEIVVTPSEKKYAAAVAYGDTSAYNSVGATVVQDGAQIVNLVNSKFSSMTASSWIDGGRNIFAYYARKGGPYRQKHLPASNLDRGLECGATRVRLKFSCKHIPIGMASAFSAYLRIWCPSWGTASYADTQTICAPNWSFNGEDVIRYVIGDDTITPASVSGGTAFSMRTYANEGNVSGTAYNDGQACDAAELDCWDREDGYTSSPYCMARVYMKSGGSVSEYYSDIQLTGNQLAALKSQIANTGDVHVGIGADVVNGFGFSGRSLAIYATKTVYIQRVELVFKITMAKIN